MSINICGVLLNKNKMLIYGLIKIFGIGIKKAISICINTGIVNKKIYKLNNNEIILLNNYIKNILIENNLKLIIKENIKRILLLNNYKSFRHKKKLPCRGQRTKTNAKTRKKMIHEIV